MVIVFRRFLQGTQSEKKTPLWAISFILQQHCSYMKLGSYMKGMLTLRNIQISVVSLLIFGPQRHLLEAGKFLELYFFLFVVCDNNI